MKRPKILFIAFVCCFFNAYFSQGQAPIKYVKINTEVFADTFLFETIFEIIGEKVKLLEYKQPFSASVKYGEVVEKSERKQLLRMDSALWTSLNYLDIHYDTLAEIETYELIEIDEGNFEVYKTISTARDSLFRTKPYYQVDTLNRLEYFLFNRLMELNIKWSKK